MPQELKQVNGRWVVTGSQRSSDLVPVPPAPGQRIRPVPARAAAPRPRPQGQAKPWWAKLGNDLLYEWRQSPVGAAWNQINVGVAGASDNALRVGYSAVQRMQGRKKADPSSGRVGAELDRFVDQTYRRLGAKPPSQMSQAERGLDQMRRSAALNLVLAPVSPGFGAARATTALGMGLRGGTAFAVNEALSTFLDDNTGGNVVNLINSLRLDPTDFKGVPFVRGLRKGEKGLGLPGAVNVGQDDMVDAAAKSLLPNAAASLAVGVGAGAAVAGVAGFRNIRRNIRAHRAVEREVQQRAKQEAMGVLQKDEAGGYNFTPEAKQPVQPAAAPAPAEAAPAPQSFEEANAAMEARLGGAQPGPTPAPAAAAPEPAPIPTIENATTENFGNARDATTQPLPEADPAIDYWTYDPELPESTALGKTLEELSDQELVTLQQGAGLPVVERVNQAVEARAAVEPRPPVAAQMVMAPADRLADDYLESVTRKLGAREDYELRPLFDPEANPGLWEKAQALTGMDDASQLSKADMLDTFDALRAEGQVPIVNRVMGSQMLATGEVQAAPKVFQYKGGVNEAGEQLGNSLEGVERWDPNAENIIQVWRDGNGELGQPGVVYVVNGHNRLAAAKRMGIPSMRVEYLDAPTAAEARLQGAISNVSDGKGTVFDAAKLAREYGITDQAQLKALGKPGASGFWKEGMALGRLPEDVFTAAVNEQIPLRRAVIIGESGVDEETMRSAYRYLVQQGPDNVKEGTLREMLAMAGQSPSASSADQPDILTGTPWGQSFNEGMLAKADLASSVRLLLSKEKKLFGTVGRQSGQIERVGQVDAGAAKDISGEAGRALNIFDDLKYQAGPVSDLLNEGTARVLAGEQPAAVAKGIKNRLAAAIAEAMGKEVGPATDVVQEDMFAAAGGRAIAGDGGVRLDPETEKIISELEDFANWIGESGDRLAEMARRGLEVSAGIEDPIDGTTAVDRIVSGPRASTPVELSPDERAAAEAQLLQEAIANGEVRPPNAPIPDLPEPAQVRLEEVAAEVATPRVQIPPAASRPITARTDESRITGAAESLMSWASNGVPGEKQAISSIEQAIDLVRSKGAILDPDAIPSLDMDAARNSKSMGRSDAATDAVAAAYRQFYGLPEPAPALASGSKAAQATADEVRLAIEHKQADAAMAWEQQQAARDAVAYEDLTFDQKKDAGLAQGIDDIYLEEMASLRADLEAGVDPPAVLESKAAKLAGLEQRFGKAVTPEVMPADVPISQLPKLSDRLGELMRAMAESDARLFREIDGLTKTTRRAIDELSGLADAPVRPEPLRLTAGAEQPEFTLPQELSKSAPRYGRLTVKFESDLDRAAYVLANDAVKPSKAAPKFRAAIEAAGMDGAEVVAHGKRVKAALKKAAQGNLTGQVELPAQPFGEVPKPPTKAGADRVRQQIEVNNQTMDDIRRKAQQEGC